MIKNTVPSNGPCDSNSYILLSINTSFNLKIPFSRKKVKFESGVPPGQAPAANFIKASKKNLSRFAKEPEQIFLRKWSCGPALTKSVAGDGG